ncbi:MAG: transposase [Holosporaceae bacterium]|jgi:transposase|nr:transposase [Holosporaceae bacterium]
MRLILAVKKGSEQPLYFRYVSGNIGDVSTFANTINEMKRNGISTAYTIVDAGYYSENSIKLLFDANISFLIRPPSNRLIYKDTIEQNADIENIKYAVKSLFKDIFPAACRG